MPDIYQVIKRPLVTEKSVMDKLGKSNTYVFEVHPDANKIQIRNAVERLFAVKVVSVNTARVHGKWRRHKQSGAQRPDWKKAFVKLEEGNAIELF
jgi:large subunit ribosomal protein L23